MPMRFDATLWHLHSSGYQNVRLRMLDDLQGRFPLVGITQSDVTQLLGLPQDIQEDVKPDVDDLYYYLGELYAGERVWLVLRACLTLNAVVGILLA